MTRAASFGVNWWVFTLAASPHFDCGDLRTLQTWSFAESFDARVAHDALSEIEGIRQRRRSAETT